MLRFLQHLDLEPFTQKYFSDENRRVFVKKGDTLLKQGEQNTRLFLVLEGKLGAFSDNIEGTKYKLFTAKPSMFVGVFSVLSESYVSMTTLLAEEDSTLAYVESDQLDEKGPDGRNFIEKVMPVLLSGLVSRLNYTQKLAKAQEKTAERLVKQAQMVSLGQMSAGIAHELNNAVAVIQRNNDWISKCLGGLLEESNPKLIQYYETGLENGRVLSSREVRSISKDLRQKYGLSQDLARKIAETGIIDKNIGLDYKNDQDRIEKRYHLWELGASLHDVLSAAHQSTHIVNSIKTLGSRNSHHEVRIDINESIYEALALLRSPLRQVKLQLSLEDVPRLVANKGELIQIWTNLIQNACDSMKLNSSEASELSITTADEGDFVVVKVTDNGPGIPEDILPKIFQPDVTTKVGGLSFGLGLGLSIVQGLTDAYGGDVSVDTSPERTTFTVRLAYGDKNE